MVSICCSEPVFYAAVEENGTSGLVIEVFDDSDKVDVDVVLLHGCPQSCMPKAVEDLLIEVSGVKKAFDPLLNSALKSIV